MCSSLPKVQLMHLRYVRQKFLFFFATKEAHQYFVIDEMSISSFFLGLFLMIQFALDGFLFVLPVIVAAFFFLFFFLFNC